MKISETKQRKAAKLVLQKGMSKAEVGRKLSISTRSVGRYVDKFYTHYMEAEQPITAMSQEYVPEETHVEHNNVEYSFSVTPTVISIIKTEGEEESNIVTITVADKAAYDEAKGFCVRYMVDNDQSLLAEAFGKFNVTESIKNLSLGRVTVDPYAGRVSFTGDSGREYDFNGVMVSRLVEKVKRGEDVTSLMKFADKLALNPSFDAIGSVYEFLEACDIRIDSDGDIICYKNVNSDFTDVRTGTFDNSVGAIVEEDRNQVNPDPSHLCSKGLHLCSLNYTPYYPGDVTVKAKLNPRDVVAIPNDYYSYDSESNSTKAKLRCCRYEVIGVVKDVEKERSIKY